ncbi:MAG: hypothetical protein AMXMBFR50_08650 [Ignavibacterium album]
MSIEIANELFDIADELDAKHYHRFAEQLRASGLSMSNNIAEGSGSEFKNEFNYFLISPEDQLLNAQTFLSC